MRRVQSSVLGDPAVRRLVMSSACSALSGGVFLGALPLAVVSGGGGPLAVGLIAGALTVWDVASTPLGALVDRLGVGRALRGAAPLRIAALVVMASHAFVHGHAAIAVLGGGALAYCLFDTLTSTATAALPALVVGTDRYDETFSLLYTINRIAELVVGPSLGAVLLIAQRWLPFLLAAAALTGAYVACRPFFTDPRTQVADPEGEVAGWMSRTVAGMRHLAKEPFLRAVAITMVGIVIAEELVGVVVTPYFRDGSDLHAWAEILGLVRSGAGVASIAAALLAAGLARRYHRIRVLAIVALGGAACPAVLAIGPHLAPVIAALLISAVAESVWVPLVQAEVARRTPTPLMARTRAAMMFLTWGALPITSVLGGAVAQAVGIRPVLATASAAALLSCLLGIWPAAARRATAPTEPA